MATRSFAEAAEDTAEIPGGGSTALAERPDTTVATPTQWSNGPQVEGEVDSGDIRLPRINLAQKSGELGEQFEPGTFVFNREVKLAGLGETFSMVALRIRKQYQEDLPYDPDGPTPQLFNTAAEVRANGGQVTDYNGEGYYREIAHILALIECPAGATEDQKDFFIYEHDGRQFALAMWTVAGSAYTGAAKPIFTASATHLRGGLHMGAWNVSAIKKSNARNSWFAPVLKSGGKTTVEFQQFAESLLTN